MTVENFNEVEQREIGGIPQGLAFVGDRKNPALLILHGGGLPLPGVASKSSYPLLAQHFLLVFWDQRGAGKSTHSSLSAGNLRLENFLGDVEEITEYIKVRFDKEKIYLMGHSWGSIIGLASVVRAPESYYAYVGVAQQINVHRSDALVFADLSQQSSKTSLSKKLSSLGQPPYQSVDDWLILRELAARNGGLVSGQGEIGLLGMLRRMFGSFLLNRDYNWLEPFRVQRNMKFVLEHTYNDLAAFDMSDLTSLELPIMLIHGRLDLNSHRQVARAWFQRLDSHNKHWVDMEHSAHMPMWEEPELFQRRVIEVLNY